MKIITPASAGDYHAWMAKALADEGVWPYLTMTPRFSMLQIEDDDWARRMIMSDDGYGVASLAFDRGGDRSVSLNVWVLSCAARSATACALLRDALLIGSRYDLQWLDSTVHESNEASRRVNEKFFGKPWGIQPAGAWNGKLRRYENRLCFRSAVVDVELRFSRSASPEEAPAL